MLTRIQDLLNTTLIIIKTLFYEGNTDHHEVIIRPFMQNHSSTMQLTSPISSENLMQSRLGKHGLQSMDVSGAGDCFFRSVSHQLYGNSNHHIRTAGVQFMRDNPERFIESNTENSWLRYLNNMSIQGTWADATYHSSSYRCIKSYYTNS